MSDRVHTRPFNLQEGARGMSDGLRGDRGRILPGKSLNPKGKAKGTLSAAGRIRAALAGDLPEILTSVIEQAKAGDLQAAKIILDRVLPPLRAEAMPVRLADFDGEAPLTDKAASVLNAAASGEISVDAAAILISALSGLSKLKEVDELTQRVALLEGRSR